MNFLITGANRGIGLELCHFALENGHHVFALVRDPHHARYLAQAKKEYPNHLTILQGDVTSAADLEKARAEVGNTPIDVLINNAGIMTDSDDRGLLSLTREDLVLTFEVNTFAPLHVARLFLPNLRKAAQPKLVNITSRMGSIDDNTSGGYYAYRMSKAALNMFNKSFAIDFPEIISLVLHPGWVRTDMGGSTAPVLPRESARGLFKFITEATKEHTGRFFDFQGKEIKW